MLGYFLLYRIVMLLIVSFPLLMKAKIGSWLVVRRRMDTILIIVYRLTLPGISGPTTPTIIPPGRDN